MTDDGKNCVRFAVIAAAYALRTMLVFVPMRSVAFFFAIPLIGGLICSTVALVAAAGIIRAGPKWARVVALFLGLPPLAFFVITVWGMLGDPSYFRLMTYQ